MKRILFLVFSFILFAKLIFSQTPNWQKFDVIRYDINLNLTNLASNFLSAKTDVIFTVKLNNVDTLYLQLAALNVDSIKYENQNLSFSHSGHILSIPLNDTLSIGDTAKVEVFYAGTPIKDGSGFGGFYFSTAYAFNLGVAINGNPPGFGRSWFPCIDSFTDKATYDLKVVTTAPQYAISGGELVGMYPNLVDNTILTHWKIEQEIPTYLMSVAVSDYIKIEKTHTGIYGQMPIEIFVRSADSSKAIGSFVNIEQILAAFESKFGPHKWPKVGYVGVPFNGGAMEHAMNIAYPLFAINGNLQYEYLIAHELAHSWFGNLVTCATAPEMWINEGWAVFSEFVYMESLYGALAAQNYIRNKRKDVIQKAHIDDNGFHAVHGVPQQNTYGTTVYQKGGLVVNAMRHYMSDSLFFETVRQYLDTYSYNSISTSELRDFFSLTSGIDMTDFFDAWVYRPGFSAFVVDSFNLEQICSRFKTTVFINQKLRGTSQYASNNIFELMFLGENNEVYTEQVHLSSTDGSVELMLLFKPVAILVDPFDKTVFATTKYNTTISSNGQHLFNDAFFRLDVSNLSANDSVILFLSHHWVEADNNICSNSNVYKVSPSRYWEVGANFNQNSTFGGRFQYNRASNSGLNDHLLLKTTTSTDSLVLLYRKDASECWRIFPFEKSGNANIGFLTTNSLPAGQYAFGISQPFQSNVNNYESKNQSLMNVYPNPSNDQFTIDIVSDCAQPSIMIFDSMGKQIKQVKLEKGQKSITWKPNGSPKGMYYIQLYDVKNKNLLESKSVIYEK